MINSITEPIILSLLPISELRGGIPLAVYKGISIHYAYFICVIANWFVIPLSFIFLDNFHVFLMENRFYSKLFNKYIRLKRTSIEKYIGSKWQYFALILLVGIPLPITGAYTGTLLAWFFEVSRKKAYLALTIGIMISGLIVSMVIYFSIRNLNIFIINI